MRNKFISWFFLMISLVVFSQKDSLKIGDRYADDQIYLSVSFSQFDNQPSSIKKSNFSYALSGGFIKDIILNRQGTISLAAGVGIGYDYFNHELKVDEINNNTVFSNGNAISENVFKAYNLEFPLEFRWRTSTAKEYNFWRVYSGVKFIYNLKNTFQYVDADATVFKYSNVTDYNKLQYGLTLSAGYDEFNINIFYGLSPIFKNGTMNGEAVETKILKFGLIFYFL
ncbi:porin family protein [uncultured Polaribacter sp.]|uniref:porin family protein n=1 Tax=uncultured Polaribacter sp. TaxID=174711 RepID=UPI002616B1C1|nr:porin family protein [uncultured Polaribacter sp.]